MLLDVVKTLYSSWELRQYQGRGNTTTCMKACYCDMWERGHSTHSKKKPEFLLKEKPESVKAEMRLGPPFKDWSNPSCRFPPPLTLITPPCLLVWSRPRWPCRCPTSLLQDQFQPSNLHIHTSLYPTATLQWKWTLWPVIILLLFTFAFCYCIYKIGTEFRQCVCLSSDFSGHTGGGGHGEHDHAGADRGSGCRRRPLHGHCWQPGPLRPGVPSSPDTQALTSILQHSWWTEEEEERSQQSAQAAAQQTTGPTGAHQCQWLWKIWFNFDFVIQFCSLSIINFFFFLPFKLYGFLSTSTTVINPDSILCTFYFFLPFAQIGHNPQI